jgi:hypothetical protein
MPHVVVHGDDRFIQVKVATEGTHGGRRKLPVRQM